MKITKSTLKKIIKEEILREMTDDEQINQLISELRPLLSLKVTPANLNRIKNVLERSGADLSSGKGVVVSQYLDNYLPFFKEWSERQSVINEEGGEDGIWHASEVYKGKDLPGLYLSGKVLDMAFLSGLDLSGADLSGASLQRAVLKECSLKGANLSGADLSYAVMTECKLHGADLSGATMTEADLLLGNLSNANLSNANLTGVSFFSAKLRRANLSGADLSVVSYRAGSLATDLSEADLTGANLSRANLTGVRYNNKTIFPKGFDRSSLEVPEQ